MQARRQALGGQRDGAVEALRVMNNHIQIRCPSAADRRAPGAGILAMDDRPA